MHFIVGVTRLSLVLLALGMLNREARSQTESFDLFDLLDGKDSFTFLVPNRKEGSDLDALSFKLGHRKNEFIQNIRTGCGCVRAEVINDDPLHNHTLVKLIGKFANNSSSEVSLEIALSTSENVVSRKYIRIMILRGAPIVFTTTEKELDLRKRSSHFDIRNVSGIEWKAVFVDTPWGRVYATRKDQIGNEEWTCDLLADLNDAKAKEFRNSTQRFQWVAESRSEDEPAVVRDVEFFCKWQDDFSWPEKERIQIARRETTTFIVTMYRRDESEKAVNIGSTCSDENVDVSISPLIVKPRFIVFRVVARNVIQEETNLNLCLQDQPDCRMVVKIIKSLK